MMEIISIEFKYRHATYYALVRVKEKDDCTEYHVTVMNGRLEQRLYGNHVFVETDGQLHIEPVPEKETGQLRVAVGLALCKHYNKPYYSNAI